MIDFRSDTVTKPTEEMRKAAYTAEVGDDVYGEDPSVRRLEEAAAEILGKEDALFVTSGTQGNQIAILVHCRPGNEVLLEAESHIFYYESGAASALAGVQTRTIPGIRGAMSADSVVSAIRPEDQHFPETGLICIENTHNRAGGAVVPASSMSEIYTVARKYDVPLHVDGARLFNASTALGCQVSDLTIHCDTVQICLSKGLGAPVGSLLAGSNEFIKKARKWRKRLGGGLRQAGIIAAPGLIALTRMPERLYLDHENAQLLAEGVSGIANLTIANQIDTNIVVVDVSKTGFTADQFSARLKEEGILANGFGNGLVRFVTHYDVTKSDIDKALTGITSVLR
ncbi:low-specificity L-threonine aldolase [Peribacillus alkalitolerans]|uniref:low-specificity L-threonine aldolase n=1 Tax=Peribacillus alkalitolerans TaxID=1550385 RepID=UPI0013CF60A4|nr:low-specificity L-threonine aldolase [Peribacillus alkalitolerans]